MRAHADDHDLRNACTCSGHPEHERCDCAFCAAMLNAFQACPQCLKPECECARIYGSPTQKDEISAALEHLTMLCNYAYEQGFHELGYDPVAVLRRELLSSGATLPQPPRSLDGKRTVRQRISEPSRSISPTPIAGEVHGHPRIQASSGD